MHGGLFTTTPGPWCGPTAIAAITGVPAEEVERLILEHRKTNPVPKRRLVGAKGRPVKTMWSSEVVPIMAKLGWRCTKAEWCRETFAGWQRRTAGKRGTYIILVTSHFVAVSGRWFTDTHKRTPVRLTEAPHKRKRVQWAWQFEKC